MDIEPSKSKPAAKRRTSRPKHLTASPRQQRLEERSSQPVHRQAIVAQKIEALLALARQAGAPAEGLRIHATSEHDERTAVTSSTPPPNPPRLEELERSLDYLLSLVQHRVRGKTKP